MSAMVPSFPLGVYLHFPWCRRRCPYCDFAVEIAREPPHREYAAAVLAELDDNAERFAGRELVSIYFGGGTPSLWEPACVAMLVRAIRGRWAAAPRLEVTMEANPTDCTPAVIAQWKVAGVTRVSVGVQSVAPGELAILGRDHRMGDGMAAIERLALAGGLDISADFIVGTPRRAKHPPLTDEPAWVDELARSAAAHASVYELTIEPGAAFAKRVADGRLVPRPAEDQAALYVFVDEALTARGFEHYEISSYARPGARAVHNGLYWSGGEYLGLGVGAASYLRSDDGRALRWTNRRRFADYARQRVAETREISAREDAADRLWLAMRTKDGASAVALGPALGEWLVSAGLAERHGDRLTPTLRGFLFADTVADRIVAALT